MNYASIHRTNVEMGCSFESETLANKFSLFRPSIAKATHVQLNALEASENNDEIGRESRQKHSPFLMENPIRKHDEKIASPLLVGFNNILPLRCWPRPTIISSIIPNESDLMLLLIDLKCRPESNATTGDETSRCCTHAECSHDESDIRRCGRQMKSLT